MGISACVFLILGASSTPRYYSATGPVSLTPAGDVVALEVVSDDKLEAAVPAEPGLSVERLFGTYRLLTGARQPAALAQSLATTGVAKTLLAAYRDPSGQLLIATTKVRAAFPRGMTADEVRRRIQEVSGRDATVLRPQENLWELAAPSPQDAVEVALRLQEGRLAAWATPDFLHKKARHYAPDDTLYPNQWHHDLIGSSGAWDITLGSPAVIIAIVDSGMDLSHPDLAAKAISPRDALQGDDDPTPDGDDAHGTATAALAAAVTNNAVGVAGVCPECSLMPIRIMSETGWGAFSADADAFYWAADHGAHIISNSWGYTSAMNISSSLSAAITYAAEEAREGKGLLILFSSGNAYRENESYELPSHPLVLGIGATNYWDQREPYSNWGQQLDLAAPAASVSADISGSRGYASNDYTYDFGGTSASCPVVAGVAGLVFSIEPTLTRGQVQSVLTATGDQVGGVTYTDGFNHQYGYGRVNALRAVQLASGGDVCQPVTETCDNGVDDDCDALADGNDPYCAPDVTEIGASCEFDFECGAVGFCQTESRGYPDGYCTMGCPEGSCPDGSACVDGFRPRCFESCSSGTDCREGYDCMTRGDDKVCVPSCTVLGCLAGETCNGTTGLCEHDGPVGIGGACSSNTQCSDNGRCLSGDFGMPGGYCVTSCASNDDCADGSHCENFGYRSYCVASCLRNSDCREGYACWPNDDGQTGTCWWACQSMSDCDGDYCNEYGLCGELTPPKTAPEPQDRSCSCDVTTACDDYQDGVCACDPECDDAGFGCAASGAGSSGLLVGLLGLLLLARRRPAG